MEDLVFLGGWLLGLMLLLLALLAVAARIYIHSFKHWMERSSQDLRAIRTELDSLKATSQARMDAFDPSEELETA